MHSLLTSSLIAMAVPAATGPCPNGVIDQLDGLYRWHVQQMDQRDEPVAALSSQRQRFTPSLFELLVQARTLTPVRDGRFLDFDVFSNTQASTFGARVTSCSAEQGGAIQAEVAVTVGLRRVPSETPTRLLYDMTRSSTGKDSWRINDITYLDGQAFQLRPFLQTLINPRP